MEMLTRVIVWLRNDLRIKDNYALNRAMKHKSAGKEIIPVYCFDPRSFSENESQTNYMTRKTGILRS
jgi:deoxyribodipyrimidine photo-lyase